MYPDVLQMHTFYRSPLGQYCEAVLAERVLDEWDEGQPLRLGGLGYTSPILQHWSDQSAVRMNLMPAPMGVMAWPEVGDNKSLLVDEIALPLPDESLDRLVLSHCLEHVHGPRRLLREAWRLLAPEGKLIMVVPNRRSLWALSDKTPFGHGRPFSRGQLAHLLEECQFDVLAWVGALYGIPRPGSAGLSSWMEKWGRRVWPGWPGVWLVEARKRVGAPIQGLPARAKRRYVAGLSPAPSAATRASSSYDSTNSP